MPTYTVEIDAIIGTGWSPGGPPPPPPPPPSGTTIYGYNTDDDAPLSSRLAKWNNRAPCVRRYSGNAYNLAGGNFPFTTATAPEKRISYSVKNNDSGPYTESGLAAGNGNALLTDYLESIPPNWFLGLTYYHEPNDDIRDGKLSIANYRNTYSQFRTAIDNATLQSGVTVKLMSNFMAYRVSDTPNYFDDSWVPPEADTMTFDLYGNPGSFTTRVLTPNCQYATGAEYGASFPVLMTRFRDTFEAIVRNGFGQRWGLLELNAPPREFDGPVNPDYLCQPDTIKGAKTRRYQGGRTATGHDSTHREVERADWMKGALQLVKTPPVILGEQMAPAEICLIWEHPQGVNWNQKFFDDNVWNACKPFIVGTPVGGGS